MDEKPEPVATPADRITTQLARFILPSSGTMIGVCTTLIGLVKIIERQTGPSQVDEYGALISVAFLCSVILSYASIRTSETRPRLSRRCERVADVLFLAGLVCLVGMAALFAFETI